MFVNYFMRFVLGNEFELLNVRQKGLFNLHYFLAFVNLTDEIEFLG